MGRGPAEGAHAAPQSLSPWAGEALEFHPEAEQEYLDALARYLERSPAAAIRFERSFDRAIRTIRDAPHRWPIYLSGCGRYTLHQFPFIVVYATLASYTVVPAIAHGRAARATGKTAYDMLQSAFAMLPADGVA